MFQLNWFVFARLEIISSALSKLPQTSAWNLKLTLPRTLPKLWAACGPNVTEIFIIAIWECSLVTYMHFFFSLYLKQKFFHRELISSYSPEWNSKAVFLFKEVSGFTHSNGKWKYSFCLHFGAIQNIEILLSAKKKFKFNTLFQTP